MSYILDALKKAEKDRRRGKESELLSASDVLPQKQTRRHKWPYLIVIALLINAGLLVWLVGLWSGKRASAPPPYAGQERAATDRLTAPLSDSAPHIPIKSGADRTERETTPAGPQAPPASVNARLPEALQHTRTQSALNTPQPGGIGQAKHKVQIENPGAIPPEMPATSPSSAAQEQANISVPKAENRIYKMRELPQSILSGLPDLSLSLHLYHPDPSSRLISIRGKTLHEGQELSAGLKLMEITPEGAVFSFQSYRFQVGLN